MPKKSGDPVILDPRDAMADGAPSLGRGCLKEWPLKALKVDPDGLEVERISKEVENGFTSMNILDSDLVKFAGGTTSYNR